MLDLVESHKGKTQSILSKFYLPAILSRKKLILQICLATFVLQIIGLAVPLFTQTIVDEVLLHDNERLLWVILGGMTIIFLIQLVFLYTRNIMVVQLKTMVEHDFFTKFFKHFVFLFQGYFDRHRREDLINRFNENLRIRQLVNPFLIRSIMDLFFILGYLPLLFFLQCKIGSIGPWAKFYFHFLCFCGITYNTKFNEPSVL